jgi:RimJ/RimL family protein N-acetyltransferase
LHDGTVALRPWSDRDLGCVAEASRDPDIPNGTTVPVPYSDAAGSAFVARQQDRWASGQGLSLAVVDASTEGAVGLACLLHRQQPGVLGVGYWTVATARRRGLTTRAVTLLSRWALGQPSVGRLEALVSPDNAASIGVLQRAGFVREGTLRGYLPTDNGRADMLIFSLLAGDLGAADPAP